MSAKRLALAVACCVLACACTEQVEPQPAEATERPICPAQIATTGASPSVIPVGCEICGDGVCNGPETPRSCPADCGTTCGDGICTRPESTATCPTDCGARCGDRACNGDESTTTCPGDCGTRCGDGACNGQETESSCAVDCAIRNDEPFQETVVQDGTNWQLKTVTGSALDPATGQTRTFNANFWMVQAGGVDSVPLSTFMKQELASQVQDANDVVTLSASIVSGIDTSLAQGSLTPELAEIAEPIDGTALPVAVEGVFGGTTRGRGCSDKVINQSRNFAVSTPFNFSTNPGSAFTGTLSGSGSIQASAIGEIQIALKRARVLFWCIPYGVRLNYARASGTANIGYGSRLDGTASFTKSWDWPIAKIKLFSLDFFIGPIPVHIGFNLPITLGLDLQASAVGHATYTGSQNATGSFNYSCTMSGCTGTSSFTQSTPQAPQLGTAEVNGRILPNVWVQAAIRGYLYDESIAYAQIGVRPYFYGDLWGYLGNNCGDADGDGVVDTVHALALDLDLQVFLTAEAGAFGRSPTRWNDLAHTSRSHTGFWDLVGSDGLQPMITGPAATTVGLAQPYGARMRPCYPYSEPVSYQFNWSDGGASSTSGAPQTDSAVNHTWTTTGPKAVSLTAISDSHGRVFNTAMSRNLQVASGAWTGWLNRDAPTGVGDFETLADFGSQVPCSAPVAIQCQTVGGVDYTQTGENYSCTPTGGGVCVNSDQIDGSCMDYQVRFLCP